MNNPHALASQVGSAASIKRIFWCVDPFEVDSSRWRAHVSFLQCWERQAKVSLAPVSVVDPLEVQWPVELNLDFQSNIQKIASESVQKRLAAFGFTHRTEEAVIIQPVASLRASAKALVDYAVLQNADVIAVSTHGRRGWNRLRLGSFAEEVLSISPLPVLTLNPSVRQTRIERILMPTDMSRASRSIFQSLLLLARDVRAEIHLFNHLDRPNLPMFAAGLLAQPDFVQATFATERKKRLQQLKDFKVAAAAQGIPCSETFVMDARQMSESVVEAARELNTDLMVLANSVRSHEKKVTPRLRDIIIESPCPVLIWPLSKEE